MSINYYTINLSFASWTTEKAIDDFKSFCYFPKTFEMDNCQLKTVSLD